MTVIVYLLIWMIISWIYSLCETLLRGTYNTCKLYSVHVLLTYISFCCFFLRSIFNTVKISVLIEYSMVLHGVGYHFLFVLVPQSCLTLCNPMDCSLHGFSAHGILQARILEWVAMPSSRGSSQLRDQTRVSYVSCIADRLLLLRHLGNLI